MIKPDRPALHRQDRRFPDGRGPRRNQPAGHAPKKWPRPSRSWAARTGACGSSNCSRQASLAEGFQTIAFSYIGPEVTRPIYRDGTIGKAKEDLEQHVPTINALLAPLSGRAVIGVQKALVTRASAVIPAVPLYISLLYKVMKAKGLHENCIQQIYRLYHDFLFSAEPASHRRAGPACVWTTGRCARTCRPRWPRLGYKSTTTTSTNWPTSKAFARNSCGIMDLAFRESTTARM